MENIYGTRLIFWGEHIWISFVWILFGVGEKGGKHMCRTFAHVDVCWERKVGEGLDILLKIDRKQLSIHIHQEPKPIRTILRVNTYYER